jgi:outer membrane lipoprotein-sorting protein
MVTTRKFHAAAAVSRILLLLCILSTTSGGLQAVNPARTIMEKMIGQMGKLLSASARVKRIERLQDGSTIAGEMQFKAMFEPRLKAYIRINAPREGTEVLYVDGWNDNSAYVSPNGFPWINVSLDPEGSTMMEKQHHSLLCIGFRFTEGVVKHIYAMHDDVFDRYVRYMGEQKWNARNTHVVKILYDDYGPVKYTVKGEESLCEIERKIFVPAAKILEMNPGMDDYWDVKPGQVINVPNFYGKESVFMIDTEHFLPIVQIVNDEKGLFEKYEYHDLRVNPRFSTTEFTEDYPDYGF